MCSNKYAKKVLAESKKPHRFACGAYVEANAKCARSHLRSSAMEALSYGCYSNFKKRGGIVVEVSTLIHSAAKGAKRYKILPIGSVEVFWVEERYVKLFRRK
jgi:hypothetical protein